MPDHAMIEDTVTLEKFPDGTMTFTPNLPTPIRRLYLAIGSLCGIAAFAVPSLERFEFGALTLISLLFLAGGVSGYCCIYALLGFPPRKR